MVRYFLFGLVALSACRLQSRRPDAPAVITDTTLRAPDGSFAPSGPLGASIHRGHAILAATGDSLPRHVGNALRCTSCHLGDGRQRDAMPLTGVYARFPQYRSRSASVQRIEDRINDCFVRSLNGTPLSFDDPAMRDIVAYLAFVSRGVAIGDSVHTVLLVVTRPDLKAGKVIFQKDCARCHGTDGAGNATYPPLWGPKSYNIGAGMARVRTAASFVRHNMPQDRPGSLTDTEAANVAAYILARPRPDFPGKEHDWPRGDAPDDTPYATLASRRSTRSSGRHH